MSGIANSWEWPIRFNEGFLVEGTPQILRVALSQGFRIWDSIDIEKNGVTVASSESTGDTKVELVGPWSLTSQAYGSGESGWSGSAQLALPSSLLAGADGVADPLAGATITVYACWERFEFGVSPSFQWGFRLYRLPLGSLQVADSTTAMTVDGRHVAQVELVDALQALDSYPINESSDFVGSGFQRPGANITYTPEGLAYVLAAEARPSLDSEYVPGRPGVPIGSPEYVGLDTEVLDVQASEVALDGQSYLGAIRSTLQPFGLIGLMTRTGEFSVKYPEDRAPSFSVGNDDVITASESMDNFSPNGVQAVVGSVNLGDSDSERYAFNTNSVAPMHVDPDHLVTSALAPPRVLSVSSVGLDDDQLGAAVELQALRIAHPQTVAVALNSPQAIEVLDVCWLDIDDIQTGRYIVTSVTQQSDAALQTSFTARRIATI